MVNPLDHPIAFVIIIAVVALMMFDFCFFHEQLCIVACPYGRLQSVMIDKRSMIISYDPSRGEPRASRPQETRRPRRQGQARGRAHRRAQHHGTVRRRLHRLPRVCHHMPDGHRHPRGAPAPSASAARSASTPATRSWTRSAAPRADPLHLAGAIEGKHTRLLRPRVLIYPAIILAVSSLFLFLLITKAPADVTVVRQTGKPFMMVPSGQVQNTMRLKIVNRDNRSHDYSVSVREPAGVSVQMVEGDTVTLSAGQSYTEPIRVLADPSMFRDGRLSVVLTVTDGEGFSTDEAFELKGPWQQPGAEPEPDTDDQAPSPPRGDPR